MLALSDAYCPWIRTCGLAVRPKPWTFPDRVLSDYLLIHVQEGAEWICVDGEHHELDAGAVYLIQPGRLSDKGSTSWSHSYSIHFDLIYDADRESIPRAPVHQRFLSAELRAHLQPDTKAVYDIDFPLLMPQALWPRFHRTLPEIVDLWRAPQAHQQLRAVQLLQDLMHAVLEYLELANNTDDIMSRLNHAEQIARASLGTDFGVSAFANAAGLSPSRFHDVYKQKRGQTPLQFLTAQRMLLARDLLVDPKLSIGSIAALVGHPDPTVFGRIFRREHGMTPRAYRAQHAS